MAAPVGSVDAEELLIGWLAARFPDAVVRDETDNNLLNELPTIQVEQLPGGNDDGFRLTRALVDVNVYAATRSEAVAIAQEVRGRLATDLAGSTTGTAVVGRVAVESLPAKRPYENTGLRRVGATYSIYLHPVS
ncbi:phage tail termination protein [Streptomyces malaysiensis]